MKNIFNIKDKYNRNWGVFRVIGNNQGKIYGYLEPTKDYEAVRDVFIAHDREISKSDGNTDTTIENILNLGAFLVDTDTNEVINIDGIIFINHENLVTCQINI